jgi:hypothetical protein
MEHMNTDTEIKTVWVTLLETRYRIVATGLTKREAERNAIKRAQEQLSRDLEYPSMFGISERAIRNNIEITSYKVPFNGTMTEG